jgi:hypothetical protein
MSSLLQDMFHDVTQHFTVAHIHSVGFNSGWYGYKHKGVFPVPSGIRLLEYCIFLDLKCFMRVYNIDLGILSMKGTVSHCNHSFICAFMAFGHFV